MLPAQEKWHGFVISVLEEVAKNASFTYTLELADYSAKGSKGYGKADEHMLANKSDIFWAGAYINSKRINNTLMSAPYSNLPLSLLVLSKKESWHDKMWSVVPCFIHFVVYVLLLCYTSCRTTFSPFAWDLWLSIFLLTCLSGFFFLLLEGRTANSVDFKGTACVSFFSMANNSFHSIFRAFSSLLQIDGWTPSTVSGKIFLLFWSFYCLVIIAALTASSAAKLAASAEGQSLYTFAHFVAGKKVLKKGACLLANSAYANFLANHPRYKYIVHVPKASLAEMKEGLLRGECDGIIERQIHLQYLTNTGDGQFALADGLKDGPQQMAVMVARNRPSMPNPQAVVDVVSYWATKLKAQGLFAALYGEQVIELSQQQRFVGEGAEEGMKRFGPEDMSGLFMILAFVWLTLLLLRLAKHSFFSVHHSADEKLAKFLKLEKLKLGDAKDQKQMMTGALAKWDSDQEYRTAIHPFVRNCLANEGVLRDETGRELTLSNWRDAHSIVNGGPPGMNESEMNKPDIRQRNTQYAHTKMMQHEDLKIVLNRVYNHNHGNDHTTPGN
jgi:hypothetical protein